MSRINNNREAWKKLFEKYNILEEIKKNGFFKITSKQINEYREARLMTKFDNSATLPKLFVDNNLAILPINSNSYMISDFNVYEKFRISNKEITKIGFESYIQSLDHNNITSEALAINCAYITGILEDFLNDEKIVPTVSGKMGSGNFKFQINRVNSDKKLEVKVENSRIEIDGGYEGVNSLALIEAKNYFSDDFMVRQIYYPYRLWNSKVTKQVRPIYMVYSNGIFNVYEYKFTDLEDYSSISLVKSKRYSIEDTEIQLNEIVNILDNVNSIKEPKISFPQADSFERIINLCELLEEEQKTKKEITENYGFNARQTNYYTDAARYLGLIEKNKNDKEIVYSISNKAKSIIKLKYKQRQLEYVRLILEHMPFKKVMQLYMENSKPPKNEQIIAVMKEQRIYNVKSEKTYKRRASTIKGWINWILDLVTE